MWFQAPWPIDRHMQLSRTRHKFHQDRSFSDYHVLRIDDKTAVTTFTVYMKDGITRSDAEVV
jgi:hypothetical protein